MSQPVTLADWQARVGQGLPAESDFIERNAEITKRYRTFYDAHRPLFKWAGLAHYASHRVGFALETLSRLIEEDLSGSPQHWRGFSNLDLELIRTTNNRVFNDIAWAHLAYAEAGLAAVERAAAGVPSMQLIVQAFQLIDQAARRSGHEGDVWRATERLARHEQREIVQGAFEQMSPVFALFLSLTTALDFDEEEWNIDDSTFSSFYVFMLSAGIDVVVRTRSLPNVCRFDHRWCWVQRALLRLWRAYDTVSTPKESPTITAPPPPARSIRSYAPWATRADRATPNAPR